MHRYRASFRAQRNWGRSWSQAAGLVFVISPLLGFMKSRRDSIFPNPKPKIQSQVVQRNQRNAST
jgi:hypothetical protein